LAITHSAVTGEGKRMTDSRGLISRRRFTALLGGAAAALPLTARAQSPAMPVVGYVRSTTAAGFAHLEAALRQGLKEAGFVEDQNVTIESRYADNQRDRLPILIGELIRRPVNVIVANQIAALAAKAATATVPIVFASGTDPVRNGLVASLNRPGGNITGTVFFGPDLGSKRLELLRQLVPKATTIAMLIHLNNPLAETERHEILAAAQARGLQLLVLDVGSERDIEAAFATAVQDGAGALLVGAAAFLNSQRERLAALAARHKLPAIFAWRDAAAASNGLMSYGDDQSDAYRQAGVYAGRILKGEKPAELPVIRSTKMEFVINLKTAKALGLDIPPTLLALADEVIE
jgi:putative tryptophan/tyrosine transport system substrate-binding protein